MQSEKQIAAAQGVLGRGGVYVGAELVKAALEAALSAAPPSPHRCRTWRGWQSMSTAPRDGTVIQAWHTVHKCPISILWNKEGHDFDGEALHWFERSYTTAWPEHAFSHWMPIPAAPAKQEG